MKVGEMVARKDRELNHVLEGQVLGWRIYRVTALSPSGRRVTLERKGNIVILTKAHQIASLEPVTPEIEAEIERDDEWLTARSVASEVARRLVDWQSRRRPPDEVRRLMNAVGPLRTLLEGSR